MKAKQQGRLPHTQHLWNRLQAEQGAVPAPLLWQLFLEAALERLSWQGTMPLSTTINFHLQPAPLLSGPRLFKDLDFFEIMWKKLDKVFTAGKEGSAIGSKVSGTSWASGGVQVPC